MKTKDRTEKLKLKDCVIDLAISYPAINFIEADAYVFKGRTLKEWKQAIYALSKAVKLKRFNSLNEKREDVYEIAEKVKGIMNN